MTEARKIRHSYGCVKETDMVVLRRYPQAKEVVESILGRETRKFYIAEVDKWVREEVWEKEEEKWDKFGAVEMKFKTAKKQEYKQKVLIDAITGTMYDFATKECLSSTRLKIID